MKAFECPGNAHDRRLYRRRIARQHAQKLAVTTPEKVVEAEIQHVESPERTSVERFSGMSSAEQADLCNWLDPTGSWHDVIRMLDPIVLELIPAEKTIETEVERVEPYRTAEWNPYNEGAEDYKARIASESQAAKILAPRRSIPVRIVSAIWSGVKWLFGGSPIDYGNLPPFSSSGRRDNPFDRD